MEGRGIVTLRMTAFLSTGALAVHELRYRLAGAGDAQSALAGHGQLAVLTPLLAVTGLVAVALLVQRLATGDAPCGTRRRNAWLVMAGALFGVFCVQEILESLLATGHAGDLGGVLRDGGWLAAPLSLAIAAAGAGLLRIVERATSMRGMATRLVRRLTADRSHVACIAGVAGLWAVPRRRLAARGPPLST